MSEDFNTRLRAPMNRRRLIGGMAGAAVTTIAIGGFVSAQSSNTSSNGTPVAGKVSDSESGSQENVVQAASDAIALVKKDRDSVASKIDVKIVDQILAGATDLQGQASSATTSSIPSQDQLASAAETTAWAARDLIEAELSAFGLPSRQIEISQELADSYAAITAANKTVTAAKNKDAATTSLLTISQQLYTSAYDQYGKGVFAQAEKTSQAASGLVDAIDELLSATDSGHGNSNGKDNHGDGEQNDAGNGTPDASGKSETNDSNRNDQGNDQQGDASSDNGGNDGNDHQDNGSEPTKPVDVPKPSF
ncbi:MAG: hypothetical protein ACR2OU_04050 [Thermomicrobiales bacterium]